MKRSSSAITPGGAKRYSKKRRVVTKKAKGTPEMYTKGQVFPDVLNTTLRYNSTMARVNPAAASYYFSIIANAMYDFDFDNVLGNKQPLYFDELLTNDGPYKSYTCSKWNTKIQIINQSTLPLMVYYAQTSSVGNSDSLLEVQNMPNVRELILTPSGGDKDSGVILAPGSLSEIYGTKRLNPGDVTGTPSTNPTIPAYGTLFFYNPGGVVGTPVDAWVKVVHDFNVELSTADAIVS